jgi:hypothetical protein
MLSGSGAKTSLKYKKWATLARQNKIYNYYATLKTIKNQRLRLLIIRNSYFLGLSNPISLLFMRIRIPILIRTKMLRIRNYL